MCSSRKKGDYHAQGSSTGSSNQGGSAGVESSFLGSNECDLLRDKDCTNRSVDGWSKGSW
jgi:hypothetical protein